MKKLNTIIITILTLLTFSACSQKTSVAPSQNKALNSVTNSTAQKESNGVMQKSLDKWLKDEWTPTVEKDETIKAKNQDKTRDFTLQEYVDKSGVYIKEKESEGKTTQSHVEKMKSMPVIGN